MHKSQGERFNVKNDQFFNTIKGSRYDVRYKLLYVGVSNAAYVANTSKYYHSRLIPVICAILSQQFYGTICVEKVP